MSPSSILQAPPGEDTGATGKKVLRRAIPDQKKIGMMRMATMFTTLIMGLMAGPLVSL